MLLAGALVLKVLKDLRLLDEAVEVVEHLGGLPDLGVRLQLLEILIALIAQLRGELTEGLELVDELVDDVPNPLAGQVELEVDVGR